MEYKIKNLKILIAQNEVDTTRRDWTRLEESRLKKIILEDTVKGAVDIKGEALIAYLDTNVCFLAEILKCKSNQPRAPIPKPYLVEGENLEQPKTQIKYKIKDIISLKDKVHRILLQK